MPEQQDNEKTPFSSVSDADHKTYLGVRRWPDLSRTERINVILTLIVRICGVLIVGSATVWLADSAIYRSPWFIFCAGIVGIGALLLLFRRLRTTDKPAKHFSLRLRILITILVAVATCAALVVIRYFHTEKQAKISRLLNHLKNSGLPPELHGMNHLEALTINQAVPSKPPFLNDLDWLHSDDLKNLTLTSPNLASLNGINGLQFLDINLTGVPLESLHSLSSFQGLRNLKLREIALAKGKLVPEIGEAFPQLTRLYLDFNRSGLSAPPILTTCKQLQELTLDMRSTNGVSKAADLSQLPNLQTLTLLVDYSKVASLKPLSGKLAALQTFTLGLDGTQLELLSDLSDSPGPENLVLQLSSPANTKFPHLGDMPRLKSLTLHMPGSRGTGIPDKTPVPDITYLAHLGELAIFLHGSETSQLPSIGKLTDLLNLDLHLENSQIQKLPDISQLHNLQRLTLDISKTNIAELPDFAPFSSSLLELRLLLANDTKIHSLRGIENLSKLQILELDISRATREKIADLTSILKLGNLRHLILGLRWEQVYDLPDLASLKGLHALELHLNGAWTSQELPDLSRLEALEELTLDLKDSRITRLPGLSRLPSLRKVTLNLENSRIQDLSALEGIHALQELILNLSGSHIQALPNLEPLANLKRVTADIKHSEITLKQTKNLVKLQELTIDKSFLSLHDLPETVKELVFDP